MGIVQKKVCPTGSGGQDDKPQKSSGWRLEEGEAIAAGHNSLQ